MQLALLHLPSEVLETVFSFLPLQERARTLPLVCRALRDLCRKSTLLWQRVTWPSAFDAAPQPAGSDEARLESLVRWLEPRAALVKDLDLLIVPPPGDAEGAARQWALVRRALLAAGPALEALHLAWLGDELVVGDWAARMPRLQHADLISPRVVITPSFGGLPELQRLWLVGRDVAYEPAAALSEDATHAAHPPHTQGGAQGSSCPCLPPSLTSLSLARSVVRRVPPGLAALTALRSLDLTRCRLLPEHQGLPFLAQLPSLEELNCSWCHLTVVPRSISCLTALRVLYLHKSFQEEPSMLDLQAALAPLGRMGMLSMSRCCLRGVPPAVPQMTSLLGLHLEGNPGLQLPPGPYLARLQELTIQWTTLFGSCAVLGAATQLTRLYVAGCHSLEAEEEEEGGEPEEGPQAAGGAAAGGAGEEGAADAAGEADAAGAAQHGEQEDEDLDELEEEQEGLGGGPAAPHHLPGAAGGGGGGAGGGAGGGLPAPAPAAAGAGAAPAAAAHATASTQHPMASSEEVAAMLAALPALRQFVDVILPDVQRGGLDAGVAALMYVLPRRCPRLELSIREDDGFGWALPDLLQRTGEAG